MPDFSEHSNRQHDDLEKILESSESLNDKLEKLVGVLEGDVAANTASAVGGGFGTGASAFLAQSSQQSGLKSALFSIHADQMENEGNRLNFQLGLERLRNSDGQTKTFKNEVMNSLKHARDRAYELGDTAEDLAIRHGENSLSAMAGAMKTAVPAGNAAVQAQAAGKPEEGLMGGIGKALIGLLGTRELKGFFGGGSGASFSDPRQYAAAAQQEINQNFGGVKDVIQQMFSADLPAESLQRRRRWSGNGFGD